MSLIPRPFSGEALEAERHREVEKKEEFRDTVKELTTTFYHGIDTSNDVVRLVTTLKQDEQSFIWRFKVRLYERVHRDQIMMVPLHWHTPGQVEVTYCADGEIIRRRTLNLELNGIGEAIITDNIGDLLEWENCLLIYLVFIPHRIRFFRPESQQILELGEVRKRHYEIYASPLASIWLDFDDWGQVSNDRESTSSSESAESPGSPVDSLAVSSVEDMGETVCRDSDQLLKLLWGDAFTSWEKIEFHCEMKWNAGGPLGYTIDFRKLYGNLFLDDGNGRVTPQRLQLTMHGNEQGIIPAELEYHTKQGLPMQRQPISIPVENSGATQLTRELDNRTWDEWIIIGLRFDALTINYEYASRTHGSGRATIQASQKIFFRFGFGSANIR